MPGLSPDTQTDEHKTLLEYVTKQWRASERFHREFRDRWDVYYSLSRNYRRMQQAHAAASPNDKDTVLQEFQRVFGQELFIPYVFTVIETTLPRIFSTDPSYVAKPNKGDDETLEACEPVRRLFERDAKQIGYSRRLQETVRSGLRYGLGVQKLFWDKRYRSGPNIVPMQSESGFKIEDGKRFLVFEGPMTLSVDIYDFRWDPVGYDLDSCGYVIHRTFRTMQYIKDRVEEGRERRAKGQEGGWEDLDLEKVEGMGSTTSRGEVWSGRMEAAGMSQFQTEGNELHEVWEFHDRDKVLTVLDKQLVVQDSTNPFLHGDFPFQIYRPTLVEHEFVGIGEAEPIAHLQYELNTMRGQRRDAANLALSPPFFYANGMLNPKKVAWGSGIFNPVDGDPKDVLFQPPIRDLPASGVSEEQALKRDIEMTTGISESTVGTGGEETATGTQLVQAAANQRIRQKTKNLHVDLLVPETAQKRELYKQNVLTKDDAPPPIRVESGETPDGRTPTGYVFIDVGPAQIHADIDIEPVDGSTEAENQVQKRADAVQLVDASAPFMDIVDHSKLYKRILREFGIDQPEDFLQAPGPKVEQVIEALGRTLQEQGMPEEQIHQLLEAVYQRLQNEPEPSPEGEGKPEEASQNGGAPQPEPTPVAAGG